MKGHLVTCLSINEMRNFEKKRYVGLGPFYPPPDSTQRQVSARLRILWDVIADLKRAQPGDICFLHTEGYIFGPYIFRTGFRESKTLPKILSSSNLSFQNWWDNAREFKNINIEEYGYVASIDKPKGCKNEGSNVMDLFLRQSLGIFNGIPPRFMYGDTKKIVKPLLHHEICQMLDMVSFNGDWEISPGPIYPTTTLQNISLDLTDYGGHLFCEKILEAWLMENMASESSQYKEVVKFFGNFTYYSNSIYTYYTNFLDVIAYDVLEDAMLNYCQQCGGVIRHFANDIRVVELKRDRLADGLRTIEQVRGYMKWANCILNPKTQVSGYIIAAGFDKEYMDYIKNNKEKDIHLLQYTLKAGTLHLVKV